MSGSDNRNATNKTEVSSLLASSDCIPWMVVLISECVAIVVLNLITMAVFMTQRQMQRRGTYILIQNLTLTDFLVGVISGSLQIERIGEYCDSWEYTMDVSSWADLIKFVFLHIFSFASLANLAVISLERVHATYRPSRHLFMNRRVYYVTIAIIWLIAIIREALQITLIKMHSQNLGNIVIVMDSALYVAYYLLVLLVVCICYTSIFIKVRFGPRLNRLDNGVIMRERQLSAILFAVTVASLITLLPIITFICLNRFHPDFPSWKSPVHFHLRMFAITCFMSNSLVNPIIYAMRLQGFRTGVRNLLCCGAPADANMAAIPL
ncbi:histamine H2 receptor-like isoform X1 [Montipora capricornis]|uniref:histamine H2 receptor-like isoform X1 n=1 Tax=Montipora capricornis TaxID=246305 RepID=UPI0035F1053C